MHRCLHSPSAAAATAGAKVRGPAVGAPGLPLYIDNAAATYPPQRRPVSMILFPQAGDARRP